MDAIYDNGISKAPCGETWPRMTPELFPQWRKVSLPQLGVSATANVKLIHVNGEIHSNVEAWDHGNKTGGNEPLRDFLPTRELDEAAQEHALDLV